MMLHVISELSLWEISHYWHGFNPNQTNPKCLPVEVEKTLRALAASTSRGVYFRCLPRSVYHEAFSDSALAYKILVRSIQRKLRSAYYYRRYNKKFLDGLSMHRIALARWCKTTGVPLPEFWFPPSDPLGGEGIEDLDDLSYLSHHGHYALLPLFEPRQTGSGDSGRTNQEYPVAADIAVAEAIAGRKNPVQEAISQIAQRNALSRYQPLHDIKRRFVREYHSGSYRSQADAARKFFKALSPHDRQVLVPSMGSKTGDQYSKEIEAKAVRTLTEALAEFKQKKPALWLGDFEL